MATLPQSTRPIYILSLLCTCAFSIVSNFI